MSEQTAEQTNEQPAAAPVAEPAPQADPAKTHVAVEWKYDASPLIACRFDPRGRYVFASAEDNSVQRWDLANGNRVSLAGHDSWVRGLAFSHDGETLITAGSDDTLIWWSASAEQPEPLRRVKAHAGWIRSISVSPDGALLASAGNDLVVRLWNVADGAPVREMAGHEKHVYSTLFHPSGEFLLSGDLKGVVNQWEVASGKLVRSFDAKALYSYNGGQQVDFGGVRSLAISGDQKHLACGGLHNASNPLGAVHDPLVLRFEWESQTLLRSHVAADVKGIAWRVLFHRDGYLIGVNGGSTGGLLLFWNAEQDAEYHRFGLPSLARDLDMHPDGLQLATAHYDRHLRISKMAEKPAQG